MKTITVGDDTWKDLTQLKLDLTLDSLDAVIKYLMKPTRKVLEAKAK